MRDLISRQAAIDAVRHAWAKGLEPSQYIEDLPPAQPEERTEERTETHACDYACDCISRQDAIRWVKTECNPYGKPTLDFESGKRVMEHLKTMPSVQPERKTGKWILKEHLYECDKCGCRISRFPFKGNIWNYYFCPNCGAKMGEGGQE